ncbi:MAG: S41 family peptidase [Bacteriovoracia bacterium]
MRLIILFLMVAACSRAPEVELIHLLKNKYANIEVNEIHKREVIARLEKLLRKKSLNKNSESDVVTLLNELGDGHIKLEHYSWPVITYESGMVIDFATEEVLACPTCKPTLKPGRYAISSVDGVALNDWLNSQSLKVAASSSHGRRFRLLNSLQESTHPFIKTVKIKGSDYELTWVVKDRFPPCVSGERINSGLYKITLRNFWCTEGKNLSRKEMVKNFKMQWDKVIAEVKVDDQVELDLRNNSGGGDEEVMHVLQTFFSKPVEVFHYQYLAQTQPGIWKKLYQTFPFKRWDSVKVDYLTKPVEAKVLDNKLQVLVGAGCFSSCEIVAGVLKHEKRAGLIGSKTHGGVGEPRSYPLGEGYSLMIPICRLWQKNGELYEGNGVSVE